MTVTKADEDGGVYCGKFDLIDIDEYQTLEPTDIVRIKETYEHGKWDYIRYRLVDRKAKVGEKVIVVVANDALVYRNVGEIVEIIETDGSSFGGMISPHDFGEKGAIYHFQYLVLEPVEPAEIVTPEEGDDKSVLDLLANLARRVAELERQQKENDDEYTVEERVARLERTFTEYMRRVNTIETDIEELNIDLGTVEENVEMILDDIVTLDERTQPLVALVKVVKSGE
ncbi:hypothetical protein Q8A72_06895 [Aeribacillus pallidus]|nr:hypothetical protein [Aeribacillus pallidus]